MSVQVTLSKDTLIVEDGTVRVQFNRQSVNRRQFFFTGNAFVAVSGYLNTKTEDIIETKPKAIEVFEAIRETLFKYASDNANKPVIPVPNPNQLALFDEEAG